MHVRTLVLWIVVAAAVSACESRDFGDALPDAGDTADTATDARVDAGDDGGAGGDPGVDASDATPDADAAAEDAADDAAVDGVADGASDGSGPSPDAELDAGNDATDGAPSDAADAAADGSGAADVGADAVADGDVGADATDAAMGGDATPGDTDLVDYGCHDLAWSPPLVCGAPVATSYTCEARQHVSEPTPIVYDMVGPACGPHRPQWGLWGAYEFMPPQRYLHNLEHGGVAFLYHPCAPEAVVAAMRAFAAGRAASDDGQVFRWVLTPVPDLEVPYVIATWGHRLALDCWDPVAVDDFIVQFYRQAPEDIGSDGSYNRLWLGRTAE